MRITTDEEKDVVRSILNEKFERNRYQRYYNKRLKKEWDEGQKSYKNKCDAQKRRTGKNKKPKRIDSSSNPLKVNENIPPIKTYPEPEPEPEPITDNKDKSLSSVMTGDENFEQFWEMYPGTQGQNRRLAFSEWQKIEPDRHSIVLGSLPSYKKHLQKNSNTNPWFPFNYLRDEIFSTFNNQSEQKYPVVKKGSEEWKAWRTYYQKQGRSFITDTITVPTKWPPA